MTLEIVRTGGEPMTHVPPSQRYIVFDAVRGLAVLLAMVDHVKVQFVPDFHLLLPFTRLSTPSFIIVFGVMIELAYLSKLRAGAPISQARRRIAIRMVQCLSVFAVITLAAMVSGNLGLAEGARALAGLGPGRFSEILMIYALLFSVVLVLLPLFVRYGAYLVLGLAALGWGLKGIAAGSLDATVPYVLTFFTGIGTGYGPALLPAMTFLAFGLALGEVMTARRRKVLPAILVMLAALILSHELSNGVMDAGRRFIAHRWTNHPGYFAFGILGFSAISLFLMMVQRTPYLKHLTAGLARAGKQSLFIYGGGNLVLNLLPAFEITRAAGAGLAFGFMMALFGAAFIRTRRPACQHPSSQIRGARFQQHFLNFTKPKRA